MGQPCLFPNLAPSTSYGYGCRCPGCVDGMNELWRNRKARLRGTKEKLLAMEKNAPGSKSFAHGTGRRYNLGCRCPMCKAWNKRMRSRRNRANKV